VTWRGLVETWRLIREWSYLLTFRHALQSAQQGRHQRWNNTRRPLLFVLLLSASSKQSPFPRQSGVSLLETGFVVHTRTNTLIFARDSVSTLQDHSKVQAGITWLWCIRVSKEGSGSWCLLIKLETGFTRPHQSPGVHRNVYLRSNMLDILRLSWNPHLSYIVSRLLVERAIRNINQ